VLVQPGAKTALGTPNSSPSAYGKVLEEREMGFHNHAGREGEKQKGEAESERFSLDTRRNYFPMRTVRQMCRLCGLWRFARPHWMKH